MPSNERLKLSGARKVGTNCVASLASLFVCRSNSLRPGALRPQLKRDPLGSAAKVTHRAPSWVVTGTMTGLRSFYAAVLALLGVSLAGCESPLSPGELRLLAQAEARWGARSFQDYAIEMRQACFCPPEATQWARLEVRSGRIARVILLDTGAEVPPDKLAYFRTVEQVFAFIRQANNADWLEDVVAAYDRQLGFPTQVDFVPKRGILDAGSTFYLRNAAPAP